jgi:glycine dehydrogenase subunit 2
MKVPLIFEKSIKGRHGVPPVTHDVPVARPEDFLPENALRDDIEGFPEVSEVETVRHFTGLSHIRYRLLSPRLLHHEA